MSAYLENLSIDSLIAHLEAAKRAGVPGDTVIRVEIFTAPSVQADDRPSFPRATYANMGRVIVSTLPRLDKGVLTVIQDGTGE